VSPTCALCATWWLLALLLKCLLDVTLPGGAQGPFLPTWASWARHLTSSVSHIEYARLVCLQLVPYVPHGGCWLCCWDACLTSPCLVRHKAPSYQPGPAGQDVSLPVYQILSMQAICVSSLCLMCNMVAAGFAVGMPA
jgi:hypothetical protein